MKKMRIKDTFIKSVPSSFGVVAIVWRLTENLPGIIRIFLSNPKQSADELARIMFSDSSPSSCNEINAVARDIETFLAGENISFSLDIARIEMCTEFQRKVLRAEHAIPRGFVSTYQRIAMHVGNPSGARAVGMALANNPYPILIPCHRAIRSDGIPGGYQGGSEMKMALLKMEGISFCENGRVATPNIFY